MGSRFDQQAAALDTRNSFSPSNPESISSWDAQKRMSDVDWNDMINNSRFSGNYDTLPVRTRGED